MKLIRRTSRLIAAAAAIGVMAATALAPASASAGPGNIDIGGIDIGNNDRFTPVLIGNKPCDGEQFKKHVCSPDYVASIDASRSYNTFYQGQPATVFTLNVHNDSPINGPGDLTSSVQGHRNPILGFEHVVGERDWSATPANASQEHWTLTLPDGLKAGQFTTVRVYVAQWNTQTVTLDVNGSWKSDCCGSWFAHDHLEPTTDNNRALAQLNWTTKK